MSFGVPAGGVPYPNPNNDYTVPTTSDGVQDLAWSPTANVLVSGSWDNFVRCWEVQQQGTQFNAIAKAQIAHDGPVLCTAFSGDGSAVFSGSCDKTAKMWNLSGPAQGQQIAQHDAPIKGITHVQQANCVVTGSWDKTVKYWDTRSPTPMGSVTLSERCYALDAKFPLLIVATANRMIDVFDMRKPTVVYKSLTSNLKYQTRTVACFPDSSGFAIGSIEGRCAIMHVEEKDKKNDFAFKCHRENNDIYPVNSIAFHPYGTFATAGGDGTYCFWDKDARQKLKAFSKANQAITVGKFNTPGDIYAYGVAYDWCKGAEHYNPQTMPSIIRLHAVNDTEIKQRKKGLPGRRSF